MMSNFFPAPERINSGQHFQIIQKLVDEKLLQVVLFTGPPRCGTTATGKFGHQAVGSHVNVNQPGMFGRAGCLQDSDSTPPRFVLASRDRNAGIWRRVYDRVFDYYQRAGAQAQNLSSSNPILLSVKETTHLTLFKKEVEQWRYLANDRVVMSVRNPVLQMRSVLLMVLDNIDTDIFSDQVDLAEQGGFIQQPLLGEHFNVEREKDVREFSVHGIPLLDPLKIALLLKSEQLSVDNTGKLGWPETYDYIKASNNFSIFDDTALKRFSIYNPFLEEPEVQVEVWKTILNPDEFSDAIQKHLGTRMEEFHKLPDHLCDALFRWRVGWLPTLKHLQNKSYPELIVSEFTAMQNNPEDSWSAILNKLRNRGMLPKDTKMCLPYDICVDKQCSQPWKSWFLDQDYKTVLGHSKITKPRNKPIDERMLPTCLRKLLPEAKLAYHLALSSDHVIGVSNKSALPLASDVSNASVVI